MFHLRDFLDRRVTAGVSDTIRERSSSMKNRKREICTSGTVRDEGGNILIYSAVRQSGADLKPPQAAVVKSPGGERCGNVGTMIPAGKVEGGERKRTKYEFLRSVADAETRLD